MNQQTNANDQSLSAADQGTRNLLLAIGVLITLLFAFLGFIAYKSFTVAAPWVLWRHLPPYPDPVIHSARVGAERLAAGAAEPGRTGQRKGGQEQSGQEGESTEGGTQQHEQAAHLQGQEAEGQPVENQEEEGEAEEEEEEYELSPEEKAWRQQVLQEGIALLNKYGCALCHGPRGQGGVKNPNYLKDTFPAFNQMATKLGIEYPEDVDVVVQLLGRGQSLNDPSKIDVPDGARIISARYETLATVIMKGNMAMKKDENGPEPIPMPSFKGVLSEQEMNKIIAAMLILYPLKEEQ